jgi:hypothetical protein
MVIYVFAYDAAANYHIFRNNWYVAAIMANVTAVDK